MIDAPALRQSPRRADGDGSLSRTLARLAWRFFFRAAGRLPFAVARPLASAIGSVAWSLGVRKAISRLNLQLAFPTLDARERDRIGRKSLSNVLTVFLELPILGRLSDDRLRRAIEIENIDLIRSIGPNGALLLSGHVGNWELLAFGAAAISGVPFSIVIQEQKDYGEIERVRTARGNQLIPTGRGAREAATLLRRGGIVAMLADQSAAVGEHLTEMFGVPTYSYSAPARLALRFRPDVIVGYAVRTADGTYRVRLSRIEHEDLEDSPEGALELTKRYVATLEQVVLAHPEQWVWGHRKWKNTPGVKYR